MATKKEAQHKKKPRAPAEKKGGPGMGAAKTKDYGKMASLLGKKFK